MSTAKHSAKTVLAQKLGLSASLPEVLGAVAISIAILVGAGFAIGAGINYSQDAKAQGVLDSVKSAELLYQSKNNAFGNLTELTTGTSPALTGTSGSTLAINADGQDYCAVIKSQSLNGTEYWLTPESGQIQTTAPTLSDTSLTCPAPTATVVRTNLATDPRASTISPSFPVGAWTPDWFGSGTSTGVTSVVSHATDGPLPALTSYQRKTWTTTGIGGNLGWSFDRMTTANVPGFPVAAGKPFSVSFYLRTSASSVTGAVQWNWLNASGAVVPGTESPFVGLTPGVWTRISATMTPPDGAVSLQVRADVHTQAGMLAGATLDGTGLLVEQSAVVSPYFDGSFSPDSTLTPAWTGAPGASASTLSRSAS